MWFDPPQILAQVHEQDRDRALLRLPLEHHNLLNDQPMESGNTPGIEVLTRIKPS